MLKLALREPKMPSNAKATPAKPSPKKDLILLFSVPIAILVIAAAIIYTPRLLANPSYDFIYSVCKSYQCYDDYGVDSSGHVSYSIRQNPNGQFGQYDTTPSELRYYDTSENSYKTISLSDAKNYQLDSSSKSPDGYSLKREDSDTGFLLWGDYHSGWVLESGQKKKSVTLTNSDDYYSEELKILGWIKR